MAWYIITRTGASLIALLLASILVFVGVRALPGDPALLLAGVESADPAVVEQIRQRYGLDDPVPVQYLRWLANVAQGDMGRSIRTGLPVGSLVLARLPVTLELAALSLLVGVLIGVPAGVLSAVRRGRLADYVGNGVGLAGLSIPNFWLGLMLIYVFAVTLGWLPTSGYVSFLDSPLENLRRMAMPALTIGTGLAAVIMRQTRSSMLESLSSDYIRTARAKGLSAWQVTWRHAVRNSVLTVLTVVGLQLGALIAGAVVTEQIFVIPGFGKLIVDAVFSRDYTVIQAVVLVSAAGYVVVNWAVDVLYSVLDPRIRLQGGPS